MEMPVILIIVLAIPLCIFLSIVRRGAHEDTIHSVIESMGGEVLYIEKRNFFSGIGPFNVVGKGRVVYRIIYRVQGKEKEGWVRFGGLMGPDWRL